MPLYEYRCRSCGQRFERVVPMSAADAQVTCPVCERQQTERLISQVAGVGAACDAGSSAGGGG